VILTSKYGVYAHVKSRIKKETGTALIHSAIRIPKQNLNYLLRKIRDEILKKKSELERKGEIIIRTNLS
jgi:hypothetical protein